MKNKKLIALILLSIAALFSLIYGITASSKISLPKEKREFVSQSPNIKKKDAVLVQVTAVQPQRSAPRTKYSSWAKDPFSPSGALIEDSGTLKLSGILWDKENPVAIINKKIVKKGDKIGNNTVVDINQVSVILNDGTQDFELKLER